MPKLKLSRHGQTQVMPTTFATANGNWFIGTSVEGLVQGHRDGHGFVQSADSEQDIYLAPAQMRSVLHLDKVCVRIISFDRKGRPEGTITDILQRSKAPIIGKLLIENGVAVVAPEDKRYGQDILLPPGAQGAALPGQIVVAEITEPPSPYAQPVGRVIEVLGSLEDSGIEIQIAVRKFGVPHVFGDATEAQADALPGHVQARDLHGRVDLTDVPLITIDGEDARDFDDAVYCEPIALAGKGKNSAQGWRLLVAIADVSHYVKPETAVDIDAFERATSVYFPRRVIPMLPEKLSNGLCSLNPNVVRCTLVCDMVIDAQGVVQAYQFYPAAIRSHARLTYNQAWAMLSNSRGPEARGLPNILEPLNHLYDLFHALRRARDVRGAIDFDTTETYIICDARGRIERIVPRERNDAHRLIEECMLAANVCSADFLKRKKQPCLYRTHEGPTPERMATLQQFLKAHNLSLGGGDSPQPKDFQELANKVRDLPEARQIHMMLLRSMQQAIYTPHNGGHFGLAYEAYTHFTSPIRRYPDLMVHRAIKAQLLGEKYKLPPVVLPESAPPARMKRGVRKESALATDVAPKTKVTASKELLAWEAAGAHTSACERRADEASRDVEAWLKCYFMRDRLGEEFTGTISSVTTFGIFIQLDALFVEGMVHISELGGDYYKFDESRFELRGERTGVRYSIGDKVHVQVGRVDLDARRMDFRLLKGRFAGGAAGGTPLGKAVAGKAAMAKPKRSRTIDNEVDNTDRLITNVDITSQILPDPLPRGARSAPRPGGSSKPGHAAVTQQMAAAKAKVKRVRAAPKKKR